MEVLSSQTLTTVSQMFSKEDADQILNDCATRDLLKLLEDTGIKLVQAGPSKEDMMETLAKKQLETLDGDDLTDMLIHGFDKGLVKKDYHEIKKMYDAIA